jgi:hypothetical protein
MNKTIPKKFTSILPPAIVDLPNERFFVITGTTDAAGWYSVDETFDYKKAMKGWTRWVPAKQKEAQPTKTLAWKIANSKNNGFYTVTFERGVWNCDCQGFGFRRKCRHIDEAKVKLN